MNKKQTFDILLWNLIGTNNSDSTRYYYEKLMKETDYPKIPSPLKHKYKKGVF